MPGDGLSSRSSRSHVLSIYTRTARGDDTQARSPSSLGAWETRSRFVVFFRWERWESTVTRWTWRREAPSSDHSGPTSRRRSCLTIHFGIWSTSRGAPPQAAWWSTSFPYWSGHPSTPSPSFRPTFSPASPSPASPSPKASATPVSPTFTPSLVSVSPLSLSLSRNASWISMLLLCTHRTGITVALHIADSSFVPPLVYVVFGSSTNLAVGNTAAVSLFLGSVIGSEISPLESPELYKHMFFKAAFFTGIFEATLGIFRWEYL